MFYYSWVLSKVVFVAVNVATNPILYFTRMSHYRAWLMKREEGTRSSQ